MRKQFVILGVILSLAHLGVSFVLFAALFSAGMHRFDHGGDPGSWERPAEIVLAVLSSPTVSPVVYFGLHTPALVQNALVLLNSLLWGFGIAWLMLRFTTRVTAAPKHIMAPPNNTP